MATVNIAADMNETEEITIADAAAAAGSFLIQFFTDGKNVFNIASQDLSGAAVDDITVNANTSYVFDITAEQAQLLDGVASTYKQYSLDGSGGKTLLNEGSVTVTPLTGGALAELTPYMNGDRITTTGGTQTEIFLAESDDTVYINANTGVAVEVWLPEANKMPGKIFDIKLIGAGTASILIPDDETELIALDTAGDCCMIKSKGVDEDDWQVFYPFIQA